MDEFLRHLKGKKYKEWDILPTSTGQQDFFHLQYCIASKEILPTHPFFNPMLPPCLEAPLHHWSTGRPFQKTWPDFYSERVLSSSNSKQQKLIVHIQKLILMLHQNCIWCGSCWFIVCYYVLFMLPLMVLKVPRFDPSNLMWVQWVLWNMNHVGEILRILEIMVKLDKHVVCSIFSWKKQDWERESALNFSWDGYNFAKILSMTLGVFDGNLTDCPDFVRYTGAREHRPCQG